MHASTERPSRVRAVPPEEWVFEVPEFLAAAVDSRPLPMCVARHPERAEIEIQELLAEPVATELSQPEGKEMAKFPQLTVELADLPQQEVQEEPSEE